MIAFPGLEDTTTITASVLDRTASVERAVTFVLVGVVTAIIVAITGPQSTNTFSVGAVELITLAGVIALDAHTIVVDQFTIFVAFALSCSVR